ncbi:hypothetical protein TNCV_192471 [Trichonephila clavipes]|nr:hypothetical protein TNCV_192471 [Trichonephila clavipes]
MAFDFRGASRSSSCNSIPTASKFSLERNYVHKLPAGENALSASTVVGSIVSSTLYTFSEYSPLNLSSSNKSISRRMVLDIS